MPFAPAIAVKPEEGSEELTRINFGLKYNGRGKKFFSSIWEKVFFVPEIYFEKSKNSTI